MYGQAGTLGLNAPELFAKGMNALLGSGISRDDAAALDYFERSADLGYGPAEVVLGSFYDVGNVVRTEPVQALAWYRKAAEQDDPLAEWLAGRLIYTGVAGPRDLNEASQLFEKAAAHADPFGEYLLGIVFLERKDYANAAVWLRKASIQGLPQAQQRLGELFRQGRGLPEDKLRAYIWLLLSFEAGNQQVLDDLQALEADLGSNEVERAKNAARDLQRKTTRGVVAGGCTGWPGEFDRIPTPPPPEMQRFCR
jgi:uncharacterized protein